MAMMKRTFVLMLIVLILLAGCSSATSNDENGKLDTENAVAVVNSKIIDISTFNIFYKMYESAYKEQYGDDVLEREFENVKFGDILKQDILDMLVEDALLREYISSTGYVVDEEEVNKNLEELNTSLDEQEETRARYEEIGVDDAFLKDQVTGSLMMTEFSSIINGEIDADQAKLDDLYENYPVQVSASHILVADDVTAALVEEKRKVGEDFAALAEEYSQDPGSASAGGSLGYFARGAMIPEFEEVAFSLPVGEISEPVQSSFGYHIIKVDDIQTVNSMIADGEDEETINVYKEQIKADLFDEYYMAKMETLKADATIETFIEKVKTEEPATEEPAATESGDTTTK